MRRGRLNIKFRIALYSALCALVIVFVLCALSCKRQRNPVVIFQLSDISTSATPFGSGEKEMMVTVFVYGEVKRPGAYRLSRGSRKYLAIEKAGGPTAISDFSGLKLFGEVEQGEMIFVPARKSSKGK